ncbi:DUF6629 family protein [Frigoriglobus tundricola]|uniref:Uncharacterized protein n=1 Tax=Frigoriglobus tundricola TaxID=2774151 RepID=A0A6M5YIP3_9BACT|nr:DUF6629 family protein [Frigoriglobus tundricola]QJW92842.1 hypothetical protein FTUN_0339 [Frigoriglobus tundricola]
MCFSANASVAAGTVLVTAGAYCIAAARRMNRAYLPLAVVPLLFGVQQFLEAAVWIGLARGLPGLVEAAAVGFLFFAAAFWPIWVPIAAAALEERREKRKLFYVFAWIGLGCALTVYVPVLIYAHDSLNVSSVSHSLRYDLSGVPAGVWAAGWVWQAMYLAAVCVPPLMSRDRSIRILGVAILVSAAITHMTFRYAFASVWCFFAALISLYIWYIMYRANRAVPPAPAGAVAAV